MDWPVLKLQFCKAVLIEFALSKYQKVFQVKWQNICKWISFAISTFVIIEEMDSASMAFLMGSWPFPFNLRSSWKIDEAPEKSILDN